MPNDSSHLSERRLRRRTFLAALGVGAAAPLAARMARLAVAAPSGRPTRLFIFYLPHGAPVEHFDPAGSGQGFDLAASGLGVLSPLMPYRELVTVIRGVSMNDGASNHAAIRAVLTGFSEGGSEDSIDYRIAQGLGVPAHVLGALPYNESWGFGSDAYLVKHGTWVRPEEDPSKAASALLGSLGQVTPGPEPEPDTQVDEAAFRSETLALTERELEGLERAVSDLTQEKTKLSLHLQAVRALKESSSGSGGGLPPTAGAPGCEGAPVLDAVDAARGLDPLDQRNLGKLLDAQLQVAAKAFECGTSRVITLQNMYANADVNMGFAGGPGIAKGHHEPISHSWDAAGREEFAVCQRWFYERLAARFLSQLDVPDPADPAHTVLENTLVYVCSEVSDGANHNSDASDVWLDGKGYRSYLPAVLIGGGGGYLKPGRVVDVNRKHTDVLATLAAAMGVSITQMGGQSVSPITEVQS